MKSFDWSSFALGLVAGTGLAAGLGYLLVRSGISQAQAALNQSLQSGIDSQLTSGSQSDVLGPAPNA